MKIRCLPALLLPLLSILAGHRSAAQAPEEPGITGMRTEYLERPLGIDAPAPRFTWVFSGTSTGFVPKGFRIRVSEDSTGLRDGGPLIWDGQGTGLVQRAVYAGKPLKPFTRYFWRVHVTGSKGEVIGSPITSFETGMMSSEGWKGAWISDGLGIDQPAAPYIRKSFRLSKTVSSARVYVSAGGLFEMHINGRRVGDHQLDPAYTRFDRRLLYVTFDVTSLLRAGDNAAGFLLGNGWYNHQSMAVWNFDKAPWRNRPAVCADIRITYVDGTTETISTGRDWRTTLSPVIFNSIYTAEHHDARREIPGWSTPGYRDTAWKPVILRSAPAPLIVAQAMHPIRATRAIPAVSVKKWSDTSYVFDIGQNISGVSELRIQGSRGTIIRLKHGERLRSDGHVDQSNIDVHYRPKDDSDPFQTDIFILSGAGEEIFRPRFNYKGFQYVELTSTSPVEVSTGSLTGYFMHSDVPSVGRISSSNPVLDAIWRATNQSYLSNLFGYPTDCPQREKNGWTGDAHIASETGLYNFDGITVYEKWLADHRDEQQPNGVLPSIIPTGGWGYEWGNGPDWTSTIAIIPWNIYLFYGDTTLLATCYDNIRRYVDRITEVSPEGITTWGLGDWVPVKSKTPVDLTSTAYYFKDVEILAKAARILGKNKDAAKYQALAEKIKAAFHRKFYRPERHIYGSGFQTELSVPLHFGLVPDSVRTRVAARLAERVRADGRHIDVGLLGTKSILNALSENGYADLAYEVALQEDFPSWGWWIRNGATTLFENWPVDAQQDISMNHIMFGEIGAWFYKALGGIRPAESHPGFRRVTLTPNFVPGLDRFSAEYTSVRGKIISAWERRKDGIQYRIGVPGGMEASLTLPGTPNQVRITRGGLNLPYRPGMILVPGDYLCTIQE
ncbi:MAG: glycoside hydrolase family 78 protein [Chitinophagaceae bacterium]|nr:glycoside hydrolase family 78 protein [Chitinophagaceae bacterium]